jgi:ABC-type Fe3+ transport system substrate-binding protein
MMDRFFRKSVSKLSSCDSVIGKSARGHILASMLFSLIFISCFVSEASSQGAAKTEWDQVLAAATKEGKVVSSIPASADLRVALEKSFKTRFPGIELELVPGEGAQTVNRIASERKAGVHYVDLSLSGPASPLSGIVRGGIAEPFEPYMILPEVKDPKNWWSGHIYVDKSNRFLYSFQAYTSAAGYYNSDLLGSHEIRSYDELLDPRWKGKIGWLDPRRANSGSNLWAFLLKIKGEEFLRRLVKQELFLEAGIRQLAESVAKGRLVMALGVSPYGAAPFLKAGLPIKPLPPAKEGDYVSSGTGGVVVIKDPPHPNATKVFINWVLGKEGQEIYNKAVGQGTRRLDVDTSWLTALGNRAAKDFMAQEDLHKFELYSEESFTKWRTRALALSAELLQ